MRWTIGAGRVVLDHQGRRCAASTAASSAARAVGHRHAGGVLGARLQEDRGGRARRAPRPARRESGPRRPSATPDDLRADGLQQVEQRREARVLDHHAVAEAAAGARATRSSASIAPSTTVSSSAAYGQSARSTARQLRQHRARRGSCSACRPSVSRPSARCRSGSSARSGTPVDRSRSKSAWRSQRARGSGPAPRRGRLGDGRAATAVGADGAGPGEQRPGRADRGGRQVELGGDRADRRQPVAGGERAVADGAADGAGPGPWRRARSRRCSRARSVVVHVL